MARFPQSKSLDTFDFEAQPSLNKALVLEPARCDWIEKRQNCIGLGPSGTGKTHIALALGLAACQKGHYVAFTTSAALVLELMSARDERRLGALQKHLNIVNLLIVDELGHLLFNAVGSELPFKGQGTSWPPISGKISIGTVSASRAQPMRSALQPEAFFGPDGLPSNEGS